MCPSLALPNARPAVSTDPGERLGGGAAWAEAWVRRGPRRRPRRGPRRGFYFGSCYSSVVFRSELARLTNKQALF